MIITSPTAMYCTLDSKEIKTVNNCIALLKDIREEMDKYDYSYLHITDDTKLARGDLTDLIIKLEDLKCVDAMY